MYRVVFFRSIASCELEYDFGATGVGREEFGDIPYIAVQNYPAVTGTVVLRNWRKLSIQNRRIDGEFCSYLQQN
jgi:hypothetical protein